MCFAARTEARGTISNPFTKFKEMRLARLARFGDMDGGAAIPTLRTLTNG